MAERRMIAKTIVESDAFMDMSAGARLLYYSLIPEADDEGFVNNPKNIMRLTGTKEDDMDELVRNKFIYTFASGVIVIKHWLIHNYIARDRFHETKYKEERDTLRLDENKAYTRSYTSRIQTDADMMTEISLDKSSIDKSRQDKTRLVEYRREKEWVDAINEEAERRRKGHFTEC